MIITSIVTGIVIAKLRSSGVLKFRRSRVVEASIAGSPEDATAIVPTQVPFPGLPVIRRQTTI